MNTPGNTGNKDSKRVITLFGLSVIISFLLWPDNTRKTPEYELNKPWPHTKLYAPYSFAIKKKSTTIAEEEKMVRNSVTPYIVVDTSIEKEVLDRVADTHITKPLLEKIYHTGILPAKDYIELKNLHHESLRVSNKTNEVILFSEVFSPQTAYNFLSHEVRDSSLMNALPYLSPNLKYDRSRTEQEIDEGLKKIVQTYGVVQEGEVVISKGDIVTEDKERLLNSLFAAFQHNVQEAWWQSDLGSLIYIILIFITLYITLRSFFREEIHSVRYMSFILATVLGYLAVARLLLQASEGTELPIHYLIPTAILPLFLRIFISKSSSVLIFIFTLLLLTPLIPNPSQYITTQIIAGIIGGFTLREVERRKDIFISIATIICIFGVLNTSYYLISGIQKSSDIQYTYLFLLINALISFLVFPGIYAVEKIFGFVSNFTLLELGNTSHPLLKQLSEKAPGTFQHSIQVGSLAEAVVRALKGNTLLVRTGALYHDIGKSVNPYYFTENQSGINPHDKLELSESARIITNHVSDGVKLANEYHLPRQIIRFIQTHHGKGKAEYFYQKYKNNFGKEPENIEDFMYEGFDPVSKEEVALALADTMEAVARSLPEKSEEKIREAVDKLVQHKMDIGLLKRAELTLNDITVAKEVLVEKLLVSYHTRIAYPKKKKVD